MERNSLLLGKSVATSKHCFSKEKMPWNSQRTAASNLNDNKQPSQASQSFLRHLMFKETKTGTSFLWKVSYFIVRSLQ